MNRFNSSADVVPSMGALRSSMEHGVGADIDLSPVSEIDSGDANRCRVEAVRQPFTLAAAGPNLNPQLAWVVDMAQAHIDDIASGIEEGLYDAAENTDLDDKQAAVTAVGAALSVAGNDSGAGTNPYLLGLRENGDAFIDGPFESPESLLGAVLHHDASPPAMIGCYRLDISAGGTPMLHSMI